MRGVFINYMFFFDKYFSSTDVLIEIAQPKNGRRVQSISSVLYAMGLEHAARIPFWRPGLLSRAMRKRLVKTACSVVYFSGEPRRLLITDQAGKNASAKKISVSYDVAALRGSQLPDDAMVLPIMFNPSLLTRDAYAKAEQLATRTDRPIKMLFAGNCDPGTYGGRSMEQKYGLLNRHRLHELSKELLGDRMFFPENYAQLREAAQDGSLRDRFVWVDTNRFAIPMQDWLTVLSMSEYFFCAPGVVYPYCHNFNESAACGCVPVLQYSDWLIPPLRDGVHCVAFDSESALLSKVSGLLAGDCDARWSEMSSAIRKYHQDYLSLDACMQQIADFISDPDRKTMTWFMAGKA